MERTPTPWEGQQGKTLTQVNPAHRWEEDCALRTIFGLFFLTMEPLIYDIVAAVTKGSAVGIASNGSWKEGSAGSRGTGNGREPFTSCLHFNAHAGNSLFIANVFIEHY